MSVSMAKRNSLVIANQEIFRNSPLAKRSQTSHGQRLTSGATNWVTGSTRPNSAMSYIVIPEEKCDIRCRSTTDPSATLPPGTIETNQVLVGSEGANEGSVSSGFTASSDTSLGMVCEVEVSNCCSSVTGTTPKDSLNPVASNSSEGNFEVDPFVVAENTMIDQSGLYEPGEFYKYS